MSRPDTIATNVNVFNDTDDDVDYEIEGGTVVDGEDRQEVKSGTVGKIEVELGGHPFPLHRVRIKNSQTGEERVIEQRFHRSKTDIHLRYQLVAE